MRELASEPGRRGGLILGWANASITEKVWLINEAHRLTPDPDTDEYVAALERERHILQDYARRNNIPKLLRFQRPRDAALKFGRKDDYWLYAWSHESTHGSDAGAIFSRKLTASDTLGIFARTNAPALMAGIATFIAESVADAGQAAATVFSWPAPTQELQDILSSIRQAAEQLHQITTARQGIGGGKSSSASEE